MTQAIFDNLNIKVLTVSDVSSRLLTSHFFDKIKHCQSLRSVKFERIRKVHTQLDTVETNLNVKKWIINFDNDDVTDSVKERLAKILVNRNDNSLLIYSDGEELKDIPQLSQQFKISPIHYC